MALNTLSTIFGFIRAAAARKLPFLRADGSPEDIYNYRLIDNLYATSGQPSETQFQLIRDAGYEVVINLAPNSVWENSVINERQILTELGLKYIHISVDFKNPEEQKFQQFVTALNEHADSKLWVHCAANMRVSAFTYRYRRQILEVDQESADSDLRAIWDPFGVWKEFIQR